MTARDRVVLAAVLAVIAFVVFVAGVAMVGGAGWAMMVGGFVALAAAVWVVSP